MVEKYLNLNLDDENSQRIAEILANKTAKKILGLIAESDNDKELSETDISNKLGMPLNTVDYNIKKLLSAGLIEKSKNFFWSVKGKKIPTFRLANKKIIISTKSSYKGIVGSALIFGALGFAANVFKNILNTSKSVYGASSIESFNLLNNQVMSKARDNVVGIVEETVPEASNLIVSNNTFTFSSLFHNVFVWIIAGALIGIIGYLIYKKLKGGNKL